MLTKNEKRVLRLLLTAFDKQYSINNAAKERDFKRFLFRSGRKIS